MLITQSTSLENVLWKNRTSCHQKLIPVPTHPQPMPHFSMGRIVDQGEVRESLDELNPIFFYFLVRVFTHHLRMPEGLLNHPGDPVKRKKG